DTICYGQLAEIKVSGCSGSATVWSVPENYLNAAPTNHGVGNLINIQINENRLFYATCADQGVVSDNSEMVLVSFSPRPAITTTPNPAVLWEGESLELYATGCKSGETYLWDDGVSSQSFSKIEVQNTTHFVQCVNASCSTEKTSFYVRVCPLLQVLNSPENDFGITPMNQPDPSKVIIASNHIKTD